jgi:hypothetical protein
MGKFFDISLGIFVVDDDAFCGLHHPQDSFVYYCDLYRD